ncbi:MAG: flagellar biosynthesis protein FlhA [Tissierellaceae bacterium]|nr:flagellar biosynthesis protein FlhA [Tissierellaceae bacterium]
MEAAIKKTIGNLSKYSDIVIAFFVVAIIGVIIIPIPSQILDLLLVLNMALSITIILLTLFTNSVLEFSTFPTLLLITTMFRLALNISSTRLILSEGNAGRVISAFGEFVAGNNYIVGAIIFIIIIIVQMVVVTSGASRVSEVTARFTLDAMPGKQMAIDADLNSGLIDEDTAKKRRNDLQREAGFYGSMDGASKFVKGDAIAGIIITIINLIGGILIFSIREGMGAMEALDVFGKLTIGAGLVSQIPSLLISIASGIIVTRSDDDQSFGESLQGEIFSSSKVILIAAAVMVIIGIVPGFPTIPFLFIAIILGVVGYLLLQNEKTEKEYKERRAETVLENTKPPEPEEGVMTFQVEPISLEIGYGLITLTDEGNDNNIISHIMAVRRQCANELGIILGPIRIRDNLQLNANEYMIKIKGNKIAGGDLYVNKYMVIEPGGSDFEFDGIAAKEPSFGLDALWIDEKDKEKAELTGYTVVDPVVVLITHLKEIIKSHSFELLGRQEVKQLLEGIKDKYNVVIDELIPDIMSLGEVQKVLQNLLKESVPINDMVTILETLADYGTMVKDSETLTEHVRQALKRTVVKPHLNQEGVLSVITIHPDLEEIIGNNIQRSTSGSIPVLEPETITRIFDNIKNVSETLIISGMQFVILASPKIRVALKNLISYTFPHISVLSLNEIPNDVEIEVLGMVEKV